MIGALLVAAAPTAVQAQEAIRTESQGIISISRGSTALITRPDSITRVSLADENIAAVIGFPPNQLVVNALSVGTTALIIWGSTGAPRLYTIEVTADVESLRRQIEELFPESGITVSTAGNTVVLNGVVRDPGVVRKVLELSNSLGAPVVNNIQVPAPEQILLHVEFAEVSRSVMKELGGDVLRVVNPQNLDRAFDRDDTHEIETLTEGFVNIMVEGENSQLEAVIRLLKNSGEFKSLAQPNLVTLEGVEASFLAGGEFPFPTLQAGASTNAVTIVFKEFGIRLNFTPNITNAGNIRLHAEPEVSSLDFANGLTIAGFQIPSLLTRRVITDVELAHGQTLAIGGLIDNSMLEDIDKIPLLGDIPILGFFFRSESARQNRTELLVLVTPYILDSDNLPAPPLPTGPPSEWEWDSHIRRWIGRPEGLGNSVFGTGGGVMPAGVDTMDAGSGGGAGTDR